MSDVPATADDTSANFRRTSSVASELQDGAGSAEAAAHGASDLMQDVERSIATLIVNSRNLSEQAQSFVAELKAA